MSKSSSPLQWPYCLRRCSYCNFNKYIPRANNNHMMTECLQRETETLLQLSQVSWYEDLLHRPHEIIQYSLQLCASPILPFISFLLAASPQYSLVVGHQAWHTLQPSPLSSKLFPGTQTFQIRLRSHLRSTQHLWECQS